MAETESIKESTEKMEKAWKNTKEEYLEIIRKFDKILNEEDKTLSYARKGLLLTGRMVFEEIVRAREMVISLLQILARMEKRIIDLESDRGQIAEERRFYKDVDAFLKSLEKERERMEKAGAEMYG